MAKSGFVQANEKIARAVANGFSHVKDTVIKGYMKIEDAFVGSYLTRDGETVAVAKERLRLEQIQRERSKRTKR